jgi:uncharacterized protein (TIGR03084 family)
MSILAGLLADLAAESADLDARVDQLPEAHWARLTPADGWTIAHQIAHLAWTDHIATLAATDRDAFWAWMNSTVFTDPDRFVDRGTESFLAPPAELLDRWRAGRAALAGALAAVPPSAKIPWFRTSMSRASMATARIMETWAHGQDVADTLGHRRAPTDRLRHIAYLGFRTLGHSFLTHGREVPATPVRLELVAPAGSGAGNVRSEERSAADGRRRRPGPSGSAASASGQSIWEYGPEDATDRVVGPALDFCLLVTQRRHRADLALVATGPVADEWLDIAQAFAGPPGTGREPTGARS